MISDVDAKVTQIRKQRNRERINEQLKPCPFCGGKAHIRNVTENDRHVYYETVCVLCEDCGAQSIRKISDGYYDSYCSDEEIAELWNRRVDKPSNGTVYFKDGRSEEILYYIDYEDNLIIEFHTVSGMSLYYAYLNAASKKTNYMENAFYKIVISADDFGYIEERLVRCCDIEKIEIIREEK